MKESYQGFVERASTELCEAVFGGESDLAGRARRLDGDVFEILKEVGLTAMSKIFARLSGKVEEEAKAEGLRVHSRTVITFNVIFGAVEVDSPYLWKQGRSMKPVKTLLGLTHQGRSEPLERALTDFGCEESFAQAARRFEEHYGWSVDKSTVRRVTEAVAREVERHLEGRLESARKLYDTPISERPGAEVLLVELDGCDIRMGEFYRDEEGEQALHRDVGWHEVRIGLATDLDGQEKGYVGRMGSYPEVVGQLFSLAACHGLSKETQVIGVADGAKGLREELAAQFPRLQFILDRPHLKSHFYEAAEALEYKGKEREQWVEKKIACIDAGEVEAVLDQLREEYSGKPHDRLRQLIGYVERFRDAIHYEDFKEQGFPIGSGEIESAHRFVPQKRLKIPGACWDPDNVNPMLALRVLRANEWWGDFWRNRRLKKAA